MIAVLEKKFAFSASLKKSISSPNPNANILFDKVQFNSDYAYNPYTGEYTAQAGGLHVFTAHVKKFSDASDRQSASVLVFVNGKEKAAADSVVPNRDEKDYAELTVALHLYKGDRVSVRPGNSYKLIGHPKVQVTFFNGHLVDYDY